MSRPPVDTDARRISSRARAIVHYRLNPDYWDYREETGNDYGRDCVVELAEAGYWRNHKIEGQIKGTKKPKESVSGSYLSISIDVKTVLYALGSPIAFVLFLVDVLNEEVYFLSLQDYFIHNPAFREKLESQKTLTIRIPKETALSRHEFQLQELAGVVYVEGPGVGLHRYSEGA